VALGDIGKKWVARDVFKLDMLKLPDPTCSIDIREEMIADVAVSAWAPQQVVSARWNLGPSKEGRWIKVLH